MQIARIIAIAGFIATVGTARAASSPIASNYIDDFGSLTPSDPASVATATDASRSSPIASNYVDDFGSLASSGSSGATATASHSSPIAANYVDDFQVPAPAQATSVPVDSLAAALVP